MGWFDYVNSAINPVKQFKWAGNKVGGYAASATGNGTGSHTYAPGATMDYNPNGPIAQNLAARQAASPGGPAAAAPPPPPRLSDQTGLNDPWHVSDQTRQDLLAQQGGLSGQFASQAQQGYNAYGQQANQGLANLYAQSQGQNSVSALQLQQGVQQNLASQQAQAASASPQNSAMAARTAAIQSGRINAGLSGQQATAGLQERNQASQLYSQQLQGLRGQDLNAALSARQNAESGYGAGATGAPQKNWSETYGPAIIAGASAISDERLKTKIKDGSKDARSALAGLSAHSFSYKNQKHGKGTQLGVMAQDLERAGLGHAVMNTPHGKMVHGAKLATSLAAMMPGLDARLSKLEGGKS